MRYYVTRTDKRWGGCEWDLGIIDGWGERSGTVVVCFTEVPGTLERNRVTVRAVGQLGKKFGFLHGVFGSKMTDGWKNGSSASSNWIC